MLLSSKRSKRKGLLAAPIVITAMLTPACSGRIYRNPAPPQEPPTTVTTPTASPDDTAVPTGEPVPTTDPSTSPTTSPEVADLQPMPTNGGGTVHRQSDGTCLYVYPPPDMSCPPKTLCNPGPPRAPLKIKCPEPHGGP